MVMMLVSLTLFGVKNAVAGLTFLGGGGSGLPSSSLDGNSTGSDTLCTCDKPGADCSVTLNDVGELVIGGPMVCKEYQEGIDPMGFFDSGTGICNSSFTFSPVTVTQGSPSTITLSVVAATGNDNNDGVTAEGYLVCSGTDAENVCPNGALSCTLNFGGVTDLSKKQLELNLSATGGFDTVGQVLKVTYNEPPAGSDVVNSSSMRWRLCHDKFGEFGVPTCEGVKGNKLRTIADGTLIVLEVDGNISPTSLNVTEPDNTTNGTLKLNLACQDDFDPGWVVENSIRIGDVPPQNEAIPAIGGCPDAVYTATFSRASIIAQGSEGDSPLQPNKTYHLPFDGLMNTGENQVYIHGAPSIVTK